jgi:hypothetical protein
LRVSGKSEINTKTLFASLVGREGEGFGGRKVEGKIEKSFTFFLEYFIENDK